MDGSNPEPRPFLSQEEEEELADFLANCSKMGYGKTGLHVLEMVEEIALKKGRKVKKYTTDGCYRRFKRRVPHMTVRRGDPYATVRANCSNRETYFKLLINEYALTH